MPTGGAVEGRPLHFQTGQELEITPATDGHEARLQFRALKAAGFALSVASCNGHSLCAPTPPSPPSLSQLTNSTSSLRLTNASAPSQSTADTPPVGGTALDCTMTCDESGVEPGHVRAQLARDSSEILAAAQVAPQIRTFLASTSPPLPPLPPPPPQSPPPLPPVKQCPSVPSGCHKRRSSWCVHRDSFWKKRTHSGTIFYRQNCPVVRDATSVCSRKMGIDCGCVAQEGCK